MKFALTILILLLFSACTTGQATNAVSRPSSCLDSDGGIDYQNAGSVLLKTNDGKTRTFSDRCEPGILIEYYCDAGNYPRYEAKECNCEISVCT